MATDTSDVRQLTLDEFRPHIESAYQHAANRIFQDVIDCGHSELLSRTESPIEAIFAVWFMAERVYRMAIEKGESETYWTVLPQVEVTTRGGVFRLDFEVCPTVGPNGSCWWTGASQEFGVSRQRIAVELDGHTFHERTKEQVAARNLRDRSLQADGWMVLHFSGSEVWRRPQECAFQTWRVIDQQSDQAWDAIYAASRVRARQGQS